MNRQQKIEYYGQQYQDIDPVPRMAAIVNKAANMTDLEFHKSMSQLFLSLRDKHTNYYIPGPHACHFAVMPIFFDFVNSMDLKKLPLLAIQRFARFSKILELAGPDIEKVEIGDILLRVNGHSFKKYYQENQWIANGANDFGGMRSANDYMTHRSGLMNFMPEEDGMTFELLSLRTLTPYTVHFPWILIREDECFKKASEVVSNITGQPMPFIPTHHNFRKSAIFDAFKPSSIKTKNNIMVGSAPFPHLRNALYPRDPIDAIEYRKTSEPGMLK